MAENACKHGGYKVTMINIARTSIIIYITTSADGSGNALLLLVHCPCCVEIMHFGSRVGTAGLRKSTA